MDVIYLVWATRGEYSDRREYPVSWFAKRADAEQRAEQLTAASEVWRLTCDDDYSRDEPEVRLVLGDPEWCQWSDTIYRVREIRVGALTPIAMPVTKAGAP